MNDSTKMVLWVIAAATLFLMWAAVPADGQPFHQPGQSDRSVILTP